MNKKLLTLFAFAPLILSSCGSASFDDDIVYAKKLNNLDKNILLAKIEKASENFKTVSFTSVVKTSNALNVEEETTTGELNAYSNYLIVSESKVESLQLHAGTGTKRVVENKEVFFDTGNAKLVNYTESSTGEVSYEFTPYTDATALAVKEAMYKDKAAELLNGLSSLNAYSNEEETKFILQNTTVNESYSAVTWGLETKELHSVTKNQTVVTLNSDLSVKTVTTFSETATNRDPVTSEWYDSDKVTHSISIVYNISYGTRKDNAKEKNKYLALFNNAQLFENNPTLTFTLKKLDSAVTKTASTSSLSYQQTGLSSVKIKGNVILTFDETYNAFGLEAKAFVLSNYSAAESVQKTIKVGLQDLAKYSSEYQTVEDFFIKVPSSVESLNLYFELDLSIGTAGTLVDLAKLYILSVNKIN